MTAVMGLGGLDAPVGVAYLAMEDEKVKAQLDKQWISTEVVAALSPPLRAAAAEEGWEALAC